MRIFITSNDCPFGCSIICTDIYSQCYFVHWHLQQCLIQLIIMMPYLSIIASKKLSQLHSCGKVTFSFVSVCHFVHRGEWWWVLMWPVPMTRWTSPYRDSQTCSTLYPLTCLLWSTFAWQSGGWHSKNASLFYMIFVMSFLEKLYQTWTKSIQI